MVINPSDSAKMRTIREDETKRKVRLGLRPAARGAAGLDSIKIWSGTFGNCSSKLGFLIVWEFCQQVMSGFEYRGSVGTDTSNILTVNQ